MNWDYVAGFFDGEGSVLHLDKHYPYTHPAKGIVVSIGQSEKNKDVLIEMRDFLLKEGLDNPRFYNGSASGKKPICLLRIGNKHDAQIFLEAIKDKVYLKREKILLALEWIKTLRKWTRPFTPAERKLLEELYIKEMSLLAIAKQLGCSQTKVWTAIKSEIYYHPNLNKMKPRKKEGE